MPPKKMPPKKIPPKKMPPKKIPPKNDDDEAVKAINAVYEAQEKKDVNAAIKASLAPSASNSTVVNASTNKTKKSINPLENRMSNNKTRRRIAEAGIASLDYGPALYDNLVCEEQAMLNNNRGVQGSNSEWECSACTYKNAKNEKNCAMCEIARNNDELGMSEKDIAEQLQEFERYKPDLTNASKTLLKLPLKSLQVDSKTADEFGLTPRGKDAQITALQQIEEQRGSKFVNIVEDEAYLSLVEKCLADPFMIMGYQNGRNNLHYESTWKKEEGKENTFIGRIYIPIEDDLNNRKYTRYPNKLMSNTDGKTIVNLSLHNWAFGLHHWHDNNNNKKNSVNQIDINIKMIKKHGVSEVESTVEDAEFFSISETQKSIPYIVHDSAYSPDTGVLALDDALDLCLCNIEIENGPTLRLIFHRHKGAYDYNSQIGGTRKRRRQSKRRQSKRRK